jgi:sucrose phosphorylase
MTTVQQSQKNSVKHILMPETLDRIGDLLLKRDVDGYDRGLFSEEDFQKICSHLKNLAAWLDENSPVFLSNVDVEFTQHDRFNEKTAAVIAYIDHIDNQSSDLNAASELADFYNTYLADVYSHLHVLPFFPSPIICEGVKGPAQRADGGFEALNYKMDQIFGTVDDLKKVNGELMYDFVLNHLSAKGDVFQKFLRDEEGYEDYFITIPKGKVDQIDLSGVFRPREHHPIVRYETPDGGEKFVWCTFSETQADLNLKNPKVFCDVMTALVQNFVGAGASWVRLDAVGYLIKMLGVEDREPLLDCFGIKETHDIIKAIRLFLSDVAPPVSLVPEVNAPPSVVNTYFGENNDEGHLVYAFSSAPLSLYTVYRQDAADILKWSEDRKDSHDRIGLAFTNTHDGIGVLPMQDVAPLKDGTPALKVLLEQIERRGGAINHKSKIVDGEPKRIPYEACITWMQAILTPPELSALKGNRLSEYEMEMIVDRYIASQSFIYAAPHCVPADYMGVIASLLNDEDLYNIAGHRRNKNRGVIDRKRFEKSLEDPETNYEHIQNRIFNRKRDMLHARKTSPAFSPHAKCDVDVVNVEGSEGDRPVYSVLRYSPHCGEKILALTNCTEQVQLAEHGIEGEIIFEDILTGIKYDQGFVTLRPYQVMWLKVLDA